MVILLCSQQDFTEALDAAANAHGTNWGQARTEKSTP
jgi:hypothetical protein